MLTVKVTPFPRAFVGVTTTWKQKGKEKFEALTYFLVLTFLHALLEQRRLNKLFFSRTGVESGSHGCSRSSWNDTSCGVHGQARGKQLGEHEPDGCVCASGRARRAVDSSDRNGLGRHSARCDLAGNEQVQQKGCSNTSLVGRCDLLTKNKSKTKTKTNVRNQG